MEATLQITDIGAGGDGIAHLDDGRAVFVPLAMTGDVVKVDVDQDHRGKLLEIIEPSADRIAPPCPHFGICGGCALQHLNEQTYRDFKIKSVTDSLLKAGIALPEKVESIFLPAGTRRRANFACRVVKGKTIIGFHERKSAAIRDVPDCLLITEDVRAVMEGMRPYIADIAGEGGKMDMLVQCVDGHREVALTGKIAPGWEAQQALSDALRTLDLARISIRARDYETYKILLEAKPYYASFDSLVVNLAPGAFLQPGKEGERALTQCVIDGAGDPSCAADLFCGNGTFTGPLLAKAARVIAADFAPDAIQSLQRAGAQAQLRNLFKDPLTPEELEGVDCAVIDPPRAGARAQIAMLAQSNVPRIVYVSCNPQSFAQDAAVLADAYRLDKLTVVDQFIWSPHTEVVGVFTRL